MFENYKNTNVQEEEAAAAAPAAVDEGPMEHNPNRNEEQPPATSDAALRPAPTANIDEPPNLLPVLMWGPCHTRQLMRSQR